MRPGQIREIVEKALRDRHPERAAELERAGKLNEFLDSRVETAMQQIEEHESPHAMKIYKGDSPFLERVQKLNEVRKRAEGVAIANAIDF